MGTIVSWKPPAEGSLKLNTYASYCSTRDGFRFVIWNHSGKVLMFGTGPLHNTINELHAELMALWKSLEYAKEYWNFGMICETDCLSLSQEVVKLEPNYSMLGSIMENLQMFLLWCRRIRVYYCLRHTNRVAHKLAKLGHSFMYGVIRNKSFYPAIFNALHMDWLAITWMKGSYFLSKKIPIYINTKKKLKVLF